MPTPALASVWDWAAANQRKKDAVQQLAPLTHAVDDLETRLDELVAETRDFDLELCTATAPGRRRFISCRPGAIDGKIAVEG